MTRSSAFEAATKLAAFNNRRVFVHRVGGRPDYAVLIVASSPAEHVEHPSYAPPDYLDFPQPELVGYVEKDGRMHELPQRMDRPPSVLPE